MNSLHLVIAIFVCSVNVSTGFFFNLDIFGNNRQELCSNYTALDVQWREVIEPLNNWNLFYMNYNEPSFYESGNLRTCIQINYKSFESETNLNSIIGQFTATKFTTSNTDANKKIRYIYSSISDVQKVCNGTWKVSIPEKKIESRVTIPIYNQESQYFCLAQCNNQCDDAEKDKSPNGTFECYGKNNQAAENFKKQYPELAKRGRFLKCSLQS